MTNRISRSIAIVVATACIGVLGVSPASAQDEDVFGDKGLQPTRDYTSLLPWEHVDVVPGNLVLTFTDLVLPGNASRALRFHRTFNSKDGIWTFGIAGVPMVVYDPRGEVPASRHFSPSDPDWFLQPEYAALTGAGPTGASRQTTRTYRHAAYSRTRRTHKERCSSTRTTAMAVSPPSPPGAQATTIIYEPGSDNRALTTVDGVTSAFTYDFAGRLRSRSEIVDGRAFDVLFTYDGNDNIQEIAYPSGRRIGYLYDSENRMTRVFNAFTQQIYASNFDYHPSGGIQQYLTSNGVQTLIGYHPTRYWPSSVDAAQLHLGYQYDLVGNVLSMLDSRANMSQTFTYDVLDRLKTVSSAGYPSMVFAYDAHGNRVTTNGEVYYPGTFRLQSFNGLTMTYDDNGNLKTGPQATYVYRPNNMMQSSTVAGVTANYGYSADDARVTKDVVGGATTYFVRGLNGEPLIEWKNTTPNAEVRDYIYAGSRLIGVFTATQPAR